ncbi:MAG: autotransporter outer membrane beta-barrel domain-containing protein [Rhizobiaceae bacterium]
MAINGSAATPVVAQEQAPFDDSGPCRESEEVSTTVICSGDWSEGVKIGSLRGGTEYLRLELSPAEEGVTPAQAVSGVDINTNGNFTIETKESDSFTITTDGENAYGIVMRDWSVSGNNEFVLIHHGDIVTAGAGSKGILVEHAHATSASTNRMVSIMHSGDITTTGASAVGINLNIKYAGLDLFHQGAINASGNGIEVISINASDDSEGEVNRNRLSVRQIGDIDTATHGGTFGIFVYSSNSASPILVAMQGNINAEKGGIHASGVTGGDINVNYAGKISSHDTLDGDFGAHGISARGSADSPRSNVTINAIGGITSSHQHGIVASTQHEDSASHITLGRAGFDGAWQDSITLLDGEVVQDSKIRAARHGIDVESGASTIDIYNVVNIAGDEFDIKGAEANDEIHNYGIFTHTGSIDLASTTDTNIITNHQGATFNSGAQIILMDPDEDESGGTFINSGDSSPGGIELAQLFEAVMDEEEEEEVLDEVWTRGIQTTQITGNFEQTQTGILIANIDTSSGASDKLEIIGGSASLAGRLLIIPTEKVINDPLRYVILTADDDELSGEMELILHSDLTPTYFSGYAIDYSQANEVAVVSRDAPTYFQVARSENQKSLAAGWLSTLPIDSEVILNLHRFAEDNEDGIRNAYDLMTGEVHASVAGVMMATNDHRSDAVLQRQYLRSRSNSAAAAAAAADNDDDEALGGYDWWMQAQGSLVELDSDDQAGTAETEYDSTGFLIGADHSNGGWTLGAVVGQSQGDLSIDDRFSNSDIETWSLGVYGSARLGAFDAASIDVNIGAIGNQHSVDATRTVAFELLGEQLEADYDATSFQAFAEIGGNIEIAENTFLHPFVGIAHAALSVDGFNERLADGGSSPVGLAVESSEQSLTTTTLGVRAGATMTEFGGGRSLNVLGMAGWRHRFGDLETEAEMSLDDGGAFVITNSPLEEDVFITELGFGVDLANNIGLSAIYHGHFSGTSRTHSLNASLIGRF